MALFPEDITYIILSRLPIKSLARFRCVCKMWLKYINDSYLHTIHVKEEPTPIMLQKPTGTVVDPKITISFLCGTTSLQKDPVLNMCYKSSNNCYCNNLLISSCNGLIMVCYEHGPSDAGTYRFSVINPLSKERHDLPPISIKISDDFFDFNGPCHAAGIGFDYSTNTLKTVFSILDTDPEFDVDVVRTMVHSPGMSSWRPISHIPAYPIIGVGIYGHGRLHWLSNDFDIPNIVWLDVKTEEFGLTKDPPRPEGDHWIFHNQLFDLNGVVGFGFVTPSCIKLWILKHEEWLLHCQFDVSPILSTYYDQLYHVEVSGSWNKDGDILLSCNNGERLLVYTLKSRDLQEVELCDRHPKACIRMYQSRMFSFHTSAYNWSSS